jgi:thiol-disulfide isomerase/thioredoxin
VAVKDDAAKLKGEDSLTYLVNDKPFQFEKLLDLKGKTVEFPNSKLTNKVVVYQIMGTWCPNCIDETKLLNSLYEKFKTDGLEIVALGYEVGVDQKEQIKRLKAFKKRLGIKYTVLLAGTNNKNVAAEQFPMLNGIMSFPTSVIADRNGKIRFVHTGFSGPATGEFYKKTCDKFQYEIELLLGLLK